LRNTHAVAGPYVAVKIRCSALSTIEIVSTQTYHNASIVNIPHAYIVDFWMTSEKSFFFYRSTVANSLGITVVTGNGDTVPDNVQNFAFGAVLVDFNNVIVSRNSHANFSISWGANALWRFFETTYVMHIIDLQDEYEPLSTPTCAFATKTTEYIAIAMNPLGGTVASRFDIHYLSDWRDMPGYRINGWFGTLQESTMPNVDGVVYTFIQVGEFVHLVYIAPTDHVLCIVRLQ